MRSFFVGLVFLLVGCAPDFAPSHAQKATDLAWRGYFGQKLPPPPVNWLIDCHHSDGTPGVQMPLANPDTNTPAGACVYSYYMPPGAPGYLDDYIYVAPLKTVHDSGLCHELKNGVDCRANWYCVDEQLMGGEPDVEGCQTYLTEHGF